MPEELTGSVIVKACGITRNDFSSRIQVKNIIVCRVRMPVDAAYTRAVRTDNRSVFLDKDTQMFYVCRYIGRDISDFDKTILMRYENIADIFLVNFYAVITGAGFSHGFLR